MLAHEYLGNGFGTVYDISTILILWFAGASAMAGLLNLVPRYLPRYGMAPQWAAAVRPLVFVLTAIAVIITLVFRADVNAQGGAYATGVLVVITSASVAVFLSALHRRKRIAAVAFAVVVAVFIYTTIANVIERPDGVRIAALFILGIIIVSIVSRVHRSFQLRARSVSLRRRRQRISWSATRTTTARSGSSRTNPATGRSTSTGRSSPTSAGTATSRSALR